MHPIEKVNHKGFIETILTGKIITFSLRVSFAVVAVAVVSMAVSNYTQRCHSHHDQERERERAIAIRPNALSNAMIAQPYQLHSFTTLSASQHIVAELRPGKRV